MKPELKIYPDKQALSKDFAKELKMLINSKDKVTIALSGGSTPKIIFDIIAEEAAEAIKWENVHFYWVDERCVPPTDSDSNYKMTVDHLLSKVNIPKGNVHRMVGENTPAEEATRYAKEIEAGVPAVNGVPQFDLVLLGMGDDGHTASVFPYQINLWDSPNLCEVAAHPESGQNRITITGKVINHAKQIAFLVTGKGKAEKVRVITKEEAGAEQFPASLVSKENLTWYLDKEAAGEI
ncbi:6-phosphogluconolactonase [Flammeovirgaceae bacterium SG7u.111]|nr:6-phosphogluconolactonase [Flammeovirgaceae bacterium SG7u.132]WPO35091.1 6-phosphogluconolactonase [Flammeovirgaceae bacterium SG7u.111]